MENKLIRIIIITCISLMTLSTLFSDAQQIKESGTDIELNKQSLERKCTSQFGQNSLALKDPIFKQLSKKTYDYNSTYFLDFIITDDQEYVICGNGGSHGCIKPFLVKTDMYGDEIWYKQYDSIGKSEFLSLDQTTDDGYIVTGFRQKYTSSSVEIFLLKIDENGTKEWIKSYNKGKDMVSNSVIFTKDEEILISGVKIDSNECNHPFLLKTDSYGNEIWFKTYDIIVPYFSTFAETIELETGEFIFSAIEEVGNFFELVLFKVDDDGNEIWKERYHILDYTIAYDFEETNTGDLIVVGYSFDNHNFTNYYMFVMKTDEFGEEYWIRIYKDKAAISVEETKDHGFIISGLSADESEGSFIKKIDSDGYEEWLKYYNEIASYLFWHIKQTNDLGFVICGYNLYPHTSGFLVKTDMMGELEWYKNYNYSDVDLSYITFYGWDHSKTVHTVQIQACYNHITISNWGQSLDYYETDIITTCPGTYEYKITWYGKEGSDNITGTFTVQAGEDKKILQNLTFCDDFPQIDNIHPEKGIYVLNKKILPFFVPVIIGKINISADVFDNSSDIDRVEFFVNDELIAIDSSEPYFLLMNLNTFGKSEIMIKAFDEWGYNNSTQFSVWSI